ncbi:MULTISPECIES: DUF4227 family protein [Virgibacillus]|nr:MULTISPECIES: DUF4227 family protein [Virgibacillus]MBS7429572.1 YqzK family protein [Virgibacillus sp. 19R1-5]MBU8565447.1 YqzK family protein [Virgibacillus pantothenticus]MBU8599747.1 YqzK family protein [Virgibacillus pantothenticus]MBU8634194.1 YqzK family protein [Virgibacillus pantothenticus]MBU8641488.1 YqzK family protein [Virgibacillus pantothenticus]
MKMMLLDMLKVFCLFIAFTLLFYYGLRVMHAEYEHYHRYDPPEGPAVKVFTEEHSFFERIHLFFRLGE